MKNNLKLVISGAFLVLASQSYVAMAAAEPCVSMESVSMCDARDLQTAEIWGMPVAFELAQLIKAEGVEVHRNLETNSSVVAVRGEPVGNFHQGFDRIADYLKTQGFNEDSSDGQNRMLISDTQGEMVVLSFHDGEKQQVSVAYWQSQPLQLETAHLAQNLRF